ncbi:hypothetical protein ABFS82_08G097500 [Erythranthe guttata]|nr:PREDICTED: uncharacterized protein LOC105951122 isoform X1 [Erythranthe guttata]|eukprot:XP_012829967.1 PREDICTED: uncharacterized protein LOC105951122 isoform X1 [Erythranthe guttata]
MLRRRLASIIPRTTISHAAPQQYISLQFLQCRADNISKPDCHFGGTRAYSSLMRLKDSVLPRWRNVLTIKSTITQSTRVGTTSNSASFHSTNASFEKWKIKFSCEVKRNQQTPKNHIRFAVREKRSDTKRALNTILSNGGCSTSTAESFPRIGDDYTDQLNKKSRIIGQARRAYHKKMKRKHRKDNLSADYDDNPDRAFVNRTFRASEIGFDWKEFYEQNKGRFGKHGSKSSTESGDKSFTVGTYADRKILGLSTTGPLEIEDVKAAFRVSALKWHPDKHQGSSKGDAEEKFKDCVNAYKSLCNTLSGAA